MDKKKCLIVFKWPINLNIFVINKLSKYYETEHIYINSFQNKSFSEIVKEINLIIDNKKIEIVFFDVDSIKLLNYFFIKKINNVKKVLMTFDDTTVHEMNAITANACDIIVSHCPFLTLKYKEKGYEAYNMFLENDGNIFKNYNLKKDIDVLFFGKLTQDRKKFIDFLISKNISVKSVGQNNNFLPLDELVKTISRSKIIINFSKTTTKTVSNHESESIYKYYYEFKGRIIMAALCGSYCVSEFSPGQTMLFNDDEISTFSDKEECLEKLNYILSNDTLLKSRTDKFHNKAKALYEEKKNFEIIFNALNKENFSRVELIKFPYWYIRISAKQIIKRNIHLTSIFKSFFELIEVWKILKKSKFYIKILVILESVLNIFWYSFMSLMKKNK
jgi:hypothetical protein